MMEIDTRILSMLVRQFRRISFKLWFRLFIFFFVIYNINVRYSTTTITALDFDKDLLEYIAKYGTYFYNGKPIIWMFWANNFTQMPPYIHLSLSSIICHNQHDFVHILVTDDNVEEILDYRVHPGYISLVPAHKSDYIRARLLDKYGGIYVDVDTIGIRSFIDLYVKLEYHDVINIDWAKDGDPMAVGVMGPMRANTSFTNEWVKRVENILYKHRKALVVNPYPITINEKYPIKWSELLRDVIKPLIIQYNSTKQVDYLKLDGAKTFGQFIVSGKKMMDRIPYMSGELLIHPTEALMYGSSLLSNSVRQSTSEKVMNSDSVLSEVIRTSYNICFNPLISLTDDIIISPKTSLLNNEKLVEQIYSFNDLADTLIVQ